MVFEDDLFLYEDFDEEEKAIVVAVFGEKDKEALIILSYLYYSFVLKLFCFYTQSVIYM